MKSNTENKDFLTTQIITYLGNKRSLIANIEKEVEEIAQKLGKEKLVCADLFSGSGIVARMLKSHSEKLIVNDLENYSATINSCYLSNYSDYPKELCAELRKTIEEKCQKEKITGIISENYAPKDDKNILAEGINESSAAEFAQYVADNAPTQSNVRGSAEYRTHLVKVLTQRALAQIGGMQ